MTPTKEVKCPIYVALQGEPPLPEEELLSIIRGMRGTPQMRALRQVAATRRAECQAAAQDPGLIVQGLSAYNSGGAQALEDLLTMLHAMQQPESTEETEAAD